jgi:hypothetical protein
MNKKSDFRHGRTTVERKRNANSNQHPQYHAPVAPLNPVRLAKAESMGETELEACRLGGRKKA